MIKCADTDGHSYGAWVWNEIDPSDPRLKICYTVQIGKQAKSLVPLLPDGFVFFMNAAPLFPSPFFLIIIIGLFCPIVGQRPPSDTATALYPLHTRASPSKSTSVLPGVAV